MVNNDPEALALGRFYAFVHRRAEFLRQREAAGDSVREAETPAAHSTSGKAGRNEEYSRNGKQ